MASDASAQLSGDRRSQRAALLRGIYAILNDGAAMLEIAGAVLEAGVKVVQYRAKRGLVAERLRRLRDMTVKHDALLVVNDDWRAAIEFDCDGVHLGPDDDGFADVSRIRSASRTHLIGLSCGTLDEVRIANARDVDYLGIGAVYRTPSKVDAGEPIGVAGLRRLANASRFPVAAIGGLGATTLDEVRQTGVAMAAMISALAGADAKGATRELVARWNGTEGPKP